MHRKIMGSPFLKMAILFSAGFLLSASHFVNEDKRPNFIIIFLDDSGWADFRPFGETSYPTPHITRLAQEGCSFHNFYVPQAVCSASRAALLSGCYPGRTKVFGAHAPGARGLDPKFATLGEVLSASGYQTAVFGKWHIGDQPETRPAARGFNRSSGLMYSNDMWEYHPSNPDFWGKWPLQYWENNEVIINRVTPKDQKQLTTWYTEHAVNFINSNSEKPFFLYVAHSMPHVPLYCSDKFFNKSGQGLYADVLMELDWSVGQIINAVKTNYLEDNTFILLTSDNGPWISYGNHAGKTPFREAKATSFDGGTRSACIIKYPGELEAGSISKKAFCSIDILPTICYLSGADLPGNDIDGMNVWDVITDKKDAVNPHAYYAFSTNGEFEAIISGDGKWKLHLAHSYRTLITAGKDGMPGTYENKMIAESLFDLENDPYEQKDQKESYPEIHARMKQLADSHKLKFYREAP